MASRQRAHGWHKRHTRGRTLAEGVGSEHDCYREAGGSLQRSLGVKLSGQVVAASLADGGREEGRAQVCTVEEEGDQELSVLGAVAEGVGEQQPAAGNVSGGAGAHAGLAPARRAARVAAGERRAVPGGD